MKFHAFHLMPYRHLDFEEANKYPSYWVVLPNKFYDPKKGSQLYQEYINQLVYAAKCGFDGTRLGLIVQEGPCAVCTDIAYILRIGLGRSQRHANGRGSTTHPLGQARA